MPDLFRSTAAALVLSERARQVATWGTQDTNTWPEWMSILMEEVGELAEAINETHFANATHPERGGIENIRQEAVQVAAVAMSIIEATLKKAAHERFMQDCRDFDAYMANKKC